MTNNNVQNIKFLRNGNVFTPSIDPVKTARQVALDAMEKQKENLADGTAILGRYKETDGVVKTLVGFAYISGETKTLTVFDVDSAGADVDKKILSAIQALDADVTSSSGKNVQVKVTEEDGKIKAVNITTDNTVNSGDVANAIKTEIDKLDYTDSAVPGQYVSQVSQADGKIAVKRVDLPSLEEVKGNGKPIVAVSENKGQVAASAGNINAEFVNIADSGEKFTASTVEGALAEIAAEIDAMDKDADVVAGQVVTTVSESDGKVTETKANVKDLQLGGYTKDTMATGDIASTDTINAALSKLENKAAAITIANADGSIKVKTGATGTDINVNIKSGEKVIKKDGNGGLYTDLDLVKIKENLPTNVKERYQLLASNDSQIGANIDIYKDSSISKIYLGYSDDTVDENTGVITSGTTGEPQSLNYVYHKEDDKYEMVHVNVSKFLVESEFASGVTADAIGVVHGVVDTNSETNSSGTAFLTVDANGFKVNGIKKEIIDRINELNATVGSTTFESGKHVAVQVVEDAGKLTALTVTESDIANKTDLDTLSGKTVTAVEMTGGTAAIAANSTDGTKKITINTDGSQILMTGYAKGSDSGAVATSDSINVAIGKLENQIASKVDGLDATVSGKTDDGKVNVKVTETNGVITAVDVVGTDIASDSALAAEIAARKAVDGQNGDTYAANANVNYIGDAGSLNDADIKLDAALKALDDKINNITIDCGTY